MAMVSPLHRVIHAGRWDAERLLAASSSSSTPRSSMPASCRCPTAPGSLALFRDKRGRTASALSLRYGAPQLLRHRLEEEAAVLRILAYGRHLILYVQTVQCDPRPVQRCVLVDALAAAPLLSGGLDGTGRALRSDATLARLWRRLSDDLCRSVLVDVCRRNGVEMDPTFMSLPGDDAKAAILARLTDGADLASVERVCTGLRRLVAGRDGELWKATYDALLRRGVSRSLPDDYSGGHSSPPEMSWKERYVRARRCRPPTPTASLVARYVQYNFQDRVFEVMLRIDPSIVTMRQNCQETQSLTEGIVG